MKILDVKGKKCPMPLIETKKALKEINPEETLKIIIDNETSVKNVSHYLEDNGIRIEKSQRGDTWEIVVNKGEADLEQTVPEAYCSAPAEKDDSYVVVFTKNRIGEGSEELGEALIGAMLNSLLELDKQPKKLIFMNSGINIVIEGSIVLHSLRDIEAKGVEIIVCGTCLDYFGKMDELAIGRISNMYEIMESMTGVGNVINI
jgi:selenium metabolism protein YedF